MRFSVTVLGWELLAIELGANTAEDEGADLSGGTTYSTPIGFTQSAGDQRWETGTEYL